MNIKTLNIVGPRRYNMLLLHVHHMFILTYLYLVLFFLLVIYLLFLFCTHPLTINVIVILTLYRSIFYMRTVSDDDFIVV